MNAVLVAALAVVWIVSGVAGFVFWWTSSHDLDTNDVPIAVISGVVLGPLAWFFGWVIHGTSTRHVLIPKRGNRA